MLLSRTFQGNKRLKVKKSKVTGETYKGGDFWGADKTTTTTKQI